MYIDVDIRDAWDELVSRGVSDIGTQFVPDIDYTIKQIDTYLLELEKLLNEIWETIPSTYDENDEKVKRHARALKKIGDLICWDICRRLEKKNK